MKNQYVGDINDYRKYGLLRSIAQTGLKIGICWMLTPDDKRTDGKFISYLQPSTKWRHSDEQLYELLKTLIDKRRRHVRHIRSSKVIPLAKYFDRVLTDDLQRRKQYLGRLLESFSDRDLVFFDPDNGIEVKSKPYGTKGSCKYVYWRELKVFYELGFSLLVYQHFPRKHREQFIKKITSRMRLVLGSRKVRAFVTSNVVFFLSLQDKHRKHFKRAMGAIDQKWKH